MSKPRIFLGSSAKQAKLVQALTRGLEDVAHVDPWTTSFNPGTNTLDRLVELAHEVDFAAFVFARDDWTSTGPAARLPRKPVRILPATTSSSRQASSAASSASAGPSSSTPSGSKLPSDLLGLTCVRYGDATTAAEMRAVNQKLRNAIEGEGRIARIDGLWWQYSLTERGPRDHPP